MFNQDFYFQTIRKYVSLFGTIFSEINITRTLDDETTNYIRVPITYSKGEKMLTRVQQAVDADRESASLTLPVMSFDMVGMQYDADRKLKSVGRSAFLYTTTPSRLRYQYNPVPYDLKFKLYIWVKNTEDGTKIIEQILPYFTPAFTIQVDLIPELGVLTDVPIILDAVNEQDMFESEFKKNQPIIWTLDFTIKANFWGPIKTAPIILFSNTNLRIADNGANTVDAVGNTDNLVNWTSVYPGQDANGVATSNASISVPATTILANSDFGYIEVASGYLGDVPQYITVGWDATADADEPSTDETQ